MLGTFFQLNHLINHFLLIVNNMLSRTCVRHMFCFIIKLMLRMYYERILWERLGGRFYLNKHVLALPQSFKV